MKNCKKIALIILAFIILISSNSIVFAERYDTGDKVIYTDKYGRATQIIDKNSWSKASDTALSIENVFSIMFVICLVLGIIIFNYQNKKGESEKLNTILTIVTILGVISLIGYGFIYLASGGWSAH